MIENNIKLGALDLELVNNINKNKLIHVGYISSQKFFNQRI